MQRDDYITRLGLTPHPEGGWFKETYHSDDRYFALESHGQRYRYTSILFLLAAGHPSHFHRLNHDELWFYHAGDPVTVHCINADGTYQTVTLGMDLVAGQVPQFCVRQGTIFASEVADTADCGLVSCVVAPGFDYQDFELFTQAELLAKYPQYGPAIERLALKTK
ncbi:cupin domain-containing protein [Levilactobacillus spicheri]|uniref:Cupin n=1 Tax=Levilactobacillus spicheri TaxID=216463 RepID=A0A0F3RW11_9LACO|nr:cupin domain-containing protein [Levilactobacillus spicheri]KJW13764.1 cupin [Levilactobacillus spicheri]